MKETGIIMSGDRPKLILDGTKTMTRRVIKLPDAPNHLGDWEATYLGGDGTTRDSRGMLVPRIDGIWHTRTGKFIKCPYGQVGDGLWVRETWASDSIDDRISPRALPDYMPVWYRADVPNGTFKWRPSIFMPRWASRILLEITEVRAERLQEITMRDAIAEGMPNMGDFTEDDFDKSGVVRRTYTDSQDRRCHCFGAKAEFSNLWDSLNAKRGYGWEVNPFVWVLSFKKLD